jgi:hypothetical protein
MPSFTVTVEFIRVAEITIDAEDGLDARSKIGNYEFDPAILGDLVGWRIAETKPTASQQPARFGEDSALSLARKRIGIPNDV